MWTENQVTLKTVTHTHITTHTLRNNLDRTAVTSTKGRRGTASENSLQRFGTEVGTIKSGVFSVFRSELLDKFDVQLKLSRVETGSQFVSS